MARRAVVTGLGVVSPLGTGAAAFWDGLVAGRSGIAPIQSFDVSGHRTRLGAEVKDFRPRETGAYLREAASQALRDAALERRDLSRVKTGVFVGTTFGECLGLNRVMDLRLSGSVCEEEMRRRCEPLLPGGLSAGLAAWLGARGSQATLTTACAAGNTALAAAACALEDGQVDAAVAAGVDLFSPAIFAGFNRLLAVAPERCAPFSAGRQGLIPGEGCAVLILEDERAARQRGARIYADFLGFGLSCDARHPTAPDAEGIARAVAACLADCGLAPEEVGYVSAHGTGTPANDRAETAAIRSVWGSRARELPVSSIKGALGHAMGAASALEAAACCLALDRGTIPPTLNFAAGDPDCDLDYVPSARAARPRFVLSNAFAFGGANCVVAFASPGAGRGRGPGPAPDVVVTAAVSFSAADPQGMAQDLIPGRDLGLLDAPIACALAAAAKALQQAGLSGGPEAGIVLESSGELETQFRFYRDLVVGGPSAVEPAQFPNNLANAAASRAAILLDLRLANVSLAGAYPSGESAVALAWRLLRRRGRGALLAGAVDGDSRSGCLLVLETEQAARARGARMLAGLELVEESFSPDGARDVQPCDCFAKVVDKVAGTGRLLDYVARSRYGGTIRLRLTPASS